MADNAMPKISVIVPVYNTSAYVSRCIDSIYAQSLSKDEFEIIAVDDGSTDDSGKILDRIVKNCENMTVIHKENGGAAAARNEGIRAARGKYLAFVDSDDYISYDMLTHLLEGINKYHTDISCISRNEEAEDGSLLADVVVPPDNDKIIGMEDFFEELLLHRGDASFCTKLVKKDDIVAAGMFPEGTSNEDFYLWLKLIPDLRSMVIMPHRDYTVYYRSSSTTRSFSRDGAFPRAFADVIVNSRHAARLVNERFPHLELQSRRFMLYNMLDYLLHIPIYKMTGDNKFYVTVRKFIRRHIPAAIRNPYLKGREKLYILLMAPSPRLARIVHKFLREHL